jgi:hypothetical protein
MYRIDNSTAATALPTPKPAGTQGFFTGGNPAIGEPATIVEADFLNTVQEELCTVATAVGAVLSKTNNGQVLAAILALIGGLTRHLLSAPLTLYVSPTGNDITGDGLSPETAYATPQAAINYLHSIDCGGQVVTVQLAHGTYPQFSVANLTGVQSPASLVITGDTATPAAVLISATGPAVPAVAVGFGGQCLLQGMRLTTSGDTFSAGIEVFNGYCELVNLDFGPCSGPHIAVGAGGIVGLVGPYTISGGAPLHMNAYAGQITTYGEVLPGSPAFTVTLTGTPAFPEGYAAAAAGGLVLAAPGLMTFSGAATGPRYAVSLCGVIATGGAGPTYFPGNAPGIVDPTTYGVYA